MTDSSLQAHIEQQSSDVLLSAPEIWMSAGQGYFYGYAGPHVMDILNRRNIRIPEAILSFPENRKKPAHLQIFRNKTSFLFSFF